MHDISGSYSYSYSYSSSFRANFEEEYEYEEEYEHNVTSPNLLFIITDQQQAATLDPGNPCLMPNLAQIAARGTRFTRCYAANPICSPSRASLFTGLLPHSHGMVDVTHAVPAYRAELQAGLAMWPQTLQAAGYHTGYFGKWHVERSNQLERFGFDVYEVEAYHKLLGLVERDDDLTERAVVQQKGYKDFLLYGVSEQPVDEMAEYQLYSQGIEFVRAAAGAPDRPWALFLSSEAPHDPYVAPRSTFERYDPAALSRPASFDDDLTGRPAIYRRIQRVWQDLDWDDYARATACYYALCSLIDDQIGRIAGVLEELGQLDNTLIVFTSDHGDYMGAHRLMLKGLPAFEEVYRVPLIVAGPGVPAGRVVNQAASLLDVGPTLVQFLAGQDFTCQGRSLLPLLQADASDWIDEAYAEMQGQRFAYQQRVLWRDRWKYVFNTFDEDELYDLAADPHELRNRAAEPDCRPVLESMAGRMWQIISETDDWNMRQAQYGMFRFAPVGPEASLTVSVNTARAGL